MHDSGIQYKHIPYSVVVLNKSGKGRQRDMRVHDGEFLFFQVARGRYGFPVQTTPKGPI